jgi:hypothetical protein
MTTSSSWATTRLRSPRAYRGAFDKPEIGSAVADRRDHVVTVAGGQNHLRGASTTSRGGGAHGHQPPRHKLFGDRQTRHHLDLRAASLSQRSESSVDVLGDAE